MLLWRSDVNILWHSRRPAEWGRRRWRGKPLLEEKPASIHAWAQAPELTWLRNSHKARNVRSRAAASHQTAPKFRRWQQAKSKLLRIETACPRTRSVVEDCSS